MKLLNFQLGNAKLDAFIRTLSLPAGKTCPGADKCLSKCVSCKIGSLNTNGTINGGGFRVQDGPNTEYRCYGSTEEAMYPSVRNCRNTNLDLLLAAKTTAKMADLICASIPPSPWPVPVRIHPVGDYFNQAYFDAWLTVAKRMPQMTFYGYTKSLPYLVKRKKQMPKNFKLVASFGGKYDSLIKKHRLKNARVVLSVKEAKDLGLELDHDDSHAYGDSKANFAILLHGNQPAGSPAARAWAALKKQGIGGYGKQKAGRVAAGVKSSGGTPPRRKVAVKAWHSYN